MIKQKKADIVLPEGLKLFLALACIILLIYLAYSLYQLTTTKTRLEQARGTLNEIVTKINNLKLIDEYIVKSPENWYLIASNKLPEGTENAPAECMNGNCLCMIEALDFEQALRKGTGISYSEKYACKTLEAKYSVEIPYEKSLIYFKELPVKLVFIFDGARIKIMQET